VGRVASVDPPEIYVTSLAEPELDEDLEELASLDCAFAATAKRQPYGISFK
jgi:hypothetical protein